MIPLMDTHLIDPCGDRPKVFELSCILVSTPESRTPGGEPSADNEPADDLKSSGAGVVDVDIDVDESAAPVMTSIEGR